MIRNPRQWQQSIKQGQVLSSSGACMRARGKPCADQATQDLNKSFSYYLMWYLCQPGHYRISFKNKMISWDRHIFMYFSLLSLQGPLFSPLWATTLPALNWIFSFLATLSGLQEKNSWIFNLGTQVRKLPWLIYLVSYWKWLLFICDIIFSRRCSFNLQRLWLQSIPNTLKNTDL